MMVRYYIYYIPFIYPVFPRFWGGRNPVQDALLSSMHQLPSFPLSLNIAVEFPHAHDSRIMEYHGNRSCLHT